NEPTHAVLVVGRIDLCAERAALEAVGRQGSGEQATEGFPHDVSLVGGRLDDPHHKVEWLLVEMYGTPVVRLHALFASDGIAVPDVCDAVRTRELCAHLLPFGPGDRLPAVQGEIRSAFG